MKKYWPEILVLVLGLMVMALLLLLGAASQGWVAPACFVAAGVVYYGWYRQLLKLAQKIQGYEPDDDDTPFFPG
jgi:hypothetical protein